MVMVMDSKGEPVDLAGEDTNEPIFGLPAKWVQESLREEAMFRGYTVVNAATVIVTHLTEIIKDNMAELLSYSEMRNLLNTLTASEGKLIEDLVPQQTSYAFIQRVLQALLAERVSIRDLPSICEALAEIIPTTKDSSTIIEHVRARLGRQICSQHVNDQGTLLLVTLSPAWERQFLEALSGEGENRMLALPPSALQDFVSKARSLFEKQAAAGQNPALLVAPVLRPWVRSIVERFRSQTAVLSQSEIHPRARIQTVGQIS